MSKYFEKIKGWYPKPWNKDKVKDAVKKRLITPEEYEIITGDPYDETE